jgi:hypothetical protein
MVLLWQSAGSARLGILEMALANAAFLLGVGARH